MEQQSYQVVKNGAGQYSLWPVGKDVPSGWTSTGWEGSKAAAMERITWLTRQPLPSEYLDFIKSQREIADRENTRAGRPEVRWSDPEEELARFAAEKEREQRGE